MVRKYLVKTDNGDVLVEVNEACKNALGNDLLILKEPNPQNTEGLQMEVPLRAFGAKVLELITMIGTGDFSASPTMLKMMIKEKATSELNRIERWAKERL